MKKSLVIVSVCLILLMSLSFVSAGWLTGNVPKEIIPGEDDEMNFYKGDVREFELKGKTYKIRIFALESGLLTFDLYDANNLDDDGEGFIFTDEGLKYVSQNSAIHPISIELTKLDQPWFKFGGWRAYLKISVSEDLGCSDSDGDLSLDESYYVKGKVTGKWPGFEHIDKEPDGCCNGCVSDSLPEMSSSTGDTLVETSCGSDGNINFTTYLCPNGCENGACVESSTSDISEISRGVFKDIGQCRVIRETTQSLTCNDICHKSNRLCIFGMYHGMVATYTRYVETGKIHRYSNGDNQVNYDGLMSCNEIPEDLEEIADFLKFHIDFDEHYDFDIDTECLCC